MEFDLVALFSNKEIAQNIISSVILMIAVYAMKTFAMRAIRNMENSSFNIKKRWLTHTRNISLAVLFVGLIIVWATELQAFAISLVAVAAALVIATKELILCLLGGLLKATNKPFKLGDRIEINGVRGDVVDHNILTTTLDEIGPGRLTHQYTGRKIVLPNSLFLSSSIYNDSILKQYYIHSFIVSCPRTERVLEHREVLLEAAQSACVDFLDKAKNYLSQLQAQEGLEMPSPEPRVSLTAPNDEKKVDLIVRVPTPARRGGKIEQEILEKYFSKLS